MSQETVEILRRASEFGAEVYDYVDLHPWAVMDGRWFGKGNGSEVPIDVRGADASRVVDGMIVSLIIGYPDVPTALDAVGCQA
jgi:hypothetical protein